MGHNIGPTIRWFRKQRKLTLKDVSSATGLSVGFLSQVEHGQSSPSLSSLRKISSALGTSIFALLAVEESRPHVVRADERTVLRWPSRNVGYELLLPSEYTGKMEIILMRLPPGVKSCDEPRAHRAGDEFLFVLDGTVTLSLADSSLRLRCGDSACFNSAVPHVYANEGRVAAVILVAMTALY